MAAYPARRAQLGAVGCGAKKVASPARAVPVGPLWFCCGREIRDEPCGRWRKCTAKSASRQQRYRTLRTIQRVPL